MEGTLDLGRGASPGVGALASYWVKKKIIIIFLCHQNILPAGLLEDHLEDYEISRINLLWLYPLTTEVSARES